MRYSLRLLQFRLKFIILTDRDISFAEIAYSLRITKNSGAQNVLKYSFIKITMVAKILLIVVINSVKISLFADIKSTMVTEILRPVVRINSVKTSPFGDIISTMVAEIIRSVADRNSVKILLFADIKSTMVAEILRTVVRKNSVKTPLWRYQIHDGCRNSASSREHKFR